MHTSKLPALALSLSLSLSLALTAQTTVTSPAGRDTSDGNTVFYHWGGDRRLQQIDNTHAAGGPLPNLRALSFRREGGGTSNVARTMDLEVRMGIGFYSAVKPEFDANYLTPATVVYTQKPTSFPDWTAVLPRPTPFDFRINFDVPFSYPGGLALIWDVLYYNSSTTSLASTDRHFVDQTTTAFGSPVGTGCTVTGAQGPFTSSLQLRNSGGAGMAFRLSGSDAPPLAPAFVLLDTVDPNLTVPGLCANLHALAVGPLLFETTTGTGAITQFDLVIPYNAALENTTFYAQLMSVDAGQPGLPIVLSDGRFAVMPVARAPGIECIYNWHVLPTRYGQMFVGGGVVAQLSM